MLVLQTQSILFCRYSEGKSDITSVNFLPIHLLAVLQPYKYAGYSQLIKTIRIETADEQLFSKNAPLLTAACELAYHTVQCSALNAEELRRENGLEVNKQIVHVLGPAIVCQTSIANIPISSSFYILYRVV